MRRDEQKIKFIKAGQLHMDGEEEDKGLKSSQDKQDTNASTIIKGGMKQEGGRKGDEGGGGEV